MFTNYSPQTIEPVWQRSWEQAGLYRALESANRPKSYCLDFFPYPSDERLHVGHCRNYIPTDVTSRYKRMRGFNVLHPMGWDAFGEPADSDEVDARETAFSQATGQQHLADREVHKVNYVPGKVLNIVTREIHATGMDRQ